MFIFVKKLGEIFLDYTFPQPASIQKIEKMTAEEYLEKMERCFTELPQCKTVFRYTDPLAREAIREVKYRGNKKIAKKFGEILYTIILDDVEDILSFQNFSSPLLIPIPSSNKHKKERGFNQTEILAESIMIFDINKIFEYQKHILIKTKNTIPQTKTKNKSERIKNPVGSFGVKTASRIKGRNIILIDDIVTTGSTLKEATKTLKKAGARKVIAYTIAH
ncbi:MAG: ComF family protein [Candidatus Pacebacteria bacterium]|nr:ComF family protein [Candidatus Paceibacterota bacterium]